MTLSNFNPAVQYEYLKFKLAKQLASYENARKLTGFIPPKYNNERKKQCLLLSNLSGQ